MIFERQLDTIVADIIDTGHAMVVSHIDSDGITAAGIMSTALDAVGVDHIVLFLKQLDQGSIEAIAEEDELTIFTDLGSGSQDQIAEAGINAIIADHHQVIGSKVERHVNPHLAGYNGTTELSGSGASFLVASRLLDGDEAGRMVPMAIVGAVGDMQDQEHGALVGLNRDVLATGLMAGSVNVEIGLRVFGRQTRPIFRALQYSHGIPGVSGNQYGSMAFLERLKIPIKGQHWNRWSDLSMRERTRIIHGVKTRIIVNGGDPGKLIGEIYTFPKEEEGTELYDAHEFSTLLNSTGRYGQAHIGLEIAKGNRSSALADAKRLLRSHRRMLSNAVRQIGISIEVVQLKNLQYFDAGDTITDTIIGIVAGMAHRDMDQSKVIIGMADIDDETTKVSARGTPDLVKAGIDLSVAMSLAASDAGGVGGGHDIAAGATIQTELKSLFLTRLDGILGAML